MRKSMQIFILISIFVVSITANNVSVNVSNGTIFGSNCPSPFSSVVAYLGIPYAQPPIGVLRWNVPVPYNSTYPNGANQATKFSPGCYQFGSFGIEAPLFSEDW
jgi:carboxylesterase type B